MGGQSRRRRWPSLRSLISNAVRQRTKLAFRAFSKIPFQIGCVEIGETGQKIVDRKSLKPDFELSPLYKDSKDLSEKQDLRVWNKTAPSFRSAASFAQDSAAFLLRSDMNNESDSNSMISRKWHEIGRRWAAIGLFENSEDCMGSRLVSRTVIFRSSKWESMNKPDLKE